MPDPLTIDRARTAVLVMDFQAGIVERIPEPGRLLELTAGVLTGARAAGLLVIYVVVGFRAGYPEASSRNQAFGAIRQSGRMLLDAPDTVVHASVAPRPGEATVVKHRVNAFHGTDLEVLLRAGNRDALILMGIATSGVVLSTVRHAADADYRLVVVRDCCAEPDAEVHECLMSKVFPRQATVTGSADLLRALGA